MRGVLSMSVTGCIVSSLVLNTPMILCVQMCRWEFLIFSGRFKLVLSVHEGEGGPRSLTFRLLRSNFMRHMEGRWQVSLSSTCKYVLVYVCG